MNRLARVACLVTLVGCRGAEPALPVLPAPTLVLPAAPLATPSVVTPLPVLMPEGGTWSLRFEYAASQRVPGAPDLDVQAEGTAVVRGAEARVSNVAVTVRPAAPAWTAVVGEAVAHLPQRLTALHWRSIGELEGGVRLDGEGDGVQAWAIADGGGIREAHARFDQTEQRGEGLQTSRLTVRMERH